MISRQVFFAVSVVALLTVLPLVQTAHAQAAKPQAEVRKVVYHADFADPRRYSAMLASINNMVTTYQNELVDYDVRIVFVSHGIRFVTADKLANTPFAEDAELARQRPDLLTRTKGMREVQGVKLKLCDITREAVSLAKDKSAGGAPSLGVPSPGATSPSVAEPSPIASPPSIAGMPSIVNVTDFTRTFSAHSGS